MGYHLERSTGLYLAILLTMMMIKILSNASHTAMGSADSDSVSLFYCNGSSVECLGRQNQDDMEFQFLMESETRRMLQSRPTTNSLNRANAACDRGNFGYKCSPSANKGVKIPENCGGDSYQRGCYRQDK